MIKTNKIKSNGSKEIDMEHVNLIICNNPKDMAVMYLHANGYASNLIDAAELYDRVNGGSKCQIKN